MRIRIRPANVADADAVCDVIRQSITGCCKADHQGDPAVIERWLANKTVGNVEKWLAVPASMALVAEEAGRMLGAVLLSGDELALCYVVPHALHKGVGKSLLLAAEAAALARGIEVLQLNSTRTAHWFYRRNGFSECGSPLVWAGLESQPMTKRLAPVAYGMHGCRE
jgi:GNAT superfamily N-acetyltransferase